MTTHASDPLTRLCVGPQATLREAMVALDRGAVEICLVTDDDNTLIGTITDGDVRRALLRGEGLDCPVGRFMRQDYTAASPATGRAEVLDLMRARFFQHMPVVDDERRLVGLHLMRELIGGATKPNWAVIMAGGLGSRLGSMTAEIPKPMIEVAGRPILERLVLHLVGYGIRRIFLSVNYKAHVIREHFSDGASFGCEIDYLEEDEPLGTAGGLSLLQEAPPADVLVLNGDLLTRADIDRLLRHHGKTKAVATIAAREYLHAVPFGVIETKSDGLMERLAEKPTQRWLVNAGMYVLSPQLVERIPKERLDMTQVFEDCLARNEPVGVFEVNGDWADIGQPADLRRARRGEP